jgi:cob(I)alamin adenosyltransferase
LRDVAGVPEPELLRGIQNDLFDLSGDLCFPMEKRKREESPHHGWSGGETGEGDRSPEQPLNRCAVSCCRAELAAAASSCANGVAGERSVVTLC